MRSQGDGIDDVASDTGHGLTELCANLLDLNLAAYHGNLVPADDGGTTALRVGPVYFVEIQDSLKVMILF